MVSVSKKREQFEDIPDAGDVPSDEPKRAFANDEVRQWFNRWGLCCFTTPGAHDIDYAGFSRAQMNLIKAAFEAGWEARKLAQDAAT